MRQKVRKSILLFSMALFPVTMNYMSPYVIVNGSFEGIIAGSFLFFGLLFVSSLFLGRAFCGWLCPAGGVQEACFPMKGKKVKGKKRFIKYAIWAPWIATIAVAAVRAGGYHAVEPLYLTDSGVSVDSIYKLVIFLFVLALFFTLSVTVGKRAGCHTVCWMAPFMVIGRRLGMLLHVPSIKLNPEAGRCVSCKRCETRCPMSLSVNAMVKRGSMANDDCIVCGECADACSEKAIRFGFGIVRPVEKELVSCAEEPLR